MKPLFISLFWGILSYLITIIPLAIIFGIKIESLNTDKETKQKITKQKNRELQLLAFIVGITVIIINLFIIFL